MNTHNIQLNKYLAKSTSGPLRLGTAGSHGNEHLQVTPGEGWEGLTIQVIFHPCQVAVQLPADGLLEVPWEATAEPLTALQGRIVFQGFDADHLVNSTDLTYTVAGHSSTTGRDEQPYTPGIVEGVLNQMAADKDDILQAAQQAAASENAAGLYAASAQSAAGQAAAGASQAAAQASAAQQSAQAAQNAQAQAAGSAAAASETLTQVQTAGQQAEQKVQDAETAALDKIAAVAPSLPAVSADTARQSVTVNPDGSGYTLAAMAPLEASIRPTANGNPAVCEDSVAWSFQGLKVYGKSVQDGTPSPENPVPIMSAGEGGSIELNITGLNLLNPDSVEIGKWLNAETGETEETNACWTSDYIAVFKCVPVYRSNSGLNRAWVYDTNKNPVKYNPFVGSFVPDINGFIRICGYIETAPASQIWVSYTNLMEYEPYTGQPLTLSTPTGLPGIPVGGGNYVDSTGQQRVCDVVDCDAGTTRRSVGVYKPSETTRSISISNGGLGSDSNTILCRFFTSINYNPNVGAAMCNFLSKKNLNIWFDDEECYNFAKDGYLDFRILKSRLSSIDLNGIQEFCASIDATFYYALATPITTPLSAEEIAAYRALTTYPGTTVVSTAEPVAGIEAQYIMNGTAAYTKITGALAQLSAANTQTSQTTDTALGA